MTSAIVDVAIVLAAIYVALAVACSWLQEQIAAFAKLRANTLEKGVRELVSRDALIFEQIASHPLVTAGSSETGIQFPSYLEPRNFSLAFWQSIFTSAAAERPSAHADPAVALAGLVVSVNTWMPATIEGRRVKRTAVALLTSAEGSYERLLGATDAWFDAQMDRVSGWYKRNAQYILIGLACVLAFGSGVDTIDLARQLYAAPAVAAVVAGEVSQSVARESNDSAAARRTDVANVVLHAQQLESLRLFWWHAPSEANTAPSTPSGVVEKIFGLAITTIAISLGAPFWFDLLKNLVNVRMAGSKPEPGSTAAKLEFARERLIDRPAEGRQRSDVCAQPRPVVQEQHVVVRGGHDAAATAVGRIERGPFFRGYDERARCGADGAPWVRSRTRGFDARSVENRDAGLRVEHEPVAARHALDGDDVARFALPIDHGGEGGNRLEMLHDRYSDDRYDQQHEHVRGGERERSEPRRSPREEQREARDRSGEDRAAEFEQLRPQLSEGRN